MLSDEIILSELESKTRNVYSTDIIKNDVVLTFGRGQDSDATNLIGELQDRGLYPSNKKSVPWNTLAKTVEEMMGKGSMPSDVQAKFGVYTQKKVKIDRKK